MILNGESLATGVNLTQLVKKTKNNFLEIGCYHGYNLAFLSKLYPNKKIYGTDPFISDGHVEGEPGYKLTKQKENLYSNIKNCENVSFYEMSSEEFLKTQINNLATMNISAVFIDGAHVLKHILIDIELAFECIKSNSSGTGDIIFHDLHIKDVLEGIEFFKQKCEENNIEYTQQLPGQFTLTV